MFCSTIIPTIGRPSLSRTVESVLNQAFSEDSFEVIVVNDSGEKLDSHDWEHSERVQIIQTSRRERRSRARWLAYRKRTNRHATYGMYLADRSRRSRRYTGSHSVPGLSWGSEYNMTPQDWQDYMNLRLGGMTTFGAGDWGPIINPHGLNIR